MLIAPRRPQSLNLSVVWPSSWLRIRGRQICSLAGRALGVCPSTGKFRNPWATITFLLAALGAVDLSPARAGLTPAEVVVVVNGGSLNSRTLANHYVALRKIPALNVVVLENVPNSEVISVDDFRNKILRPLLTEIENRKLMSHVQCVAYSADFPTGIDISEDVKELELHTLYTKIASINALTYSYASVLAANPAYLHLDSNFYARRPLDTYFTSPGGQSTKDQWLEIERLRALEQHAEAADALEKIVADHPHQFPMAYLAAAEAAMGGDNPRAIRLLEQAISKGWTSANYLANDERFDALREDSEFQVLEYLLDASVRELQPATGFDARTAWTPNGVPVRDPKAVNEKKFGMTYLLSVVLGVTRGSGTTLAEAIAALERSSQADFTHPQGGFYFCLTADVRTTTRKWGFIGAVDDLKQMGYEAEIVPDALPMNKSSVLGAQLGTASFDWSSSGSQFVPGALADNLTSLGGVMTSGSGQTKLTELIKAGAAGSSGTVTEPYALQAKFPHPQMYVYYARGASLAEAFYLSVTGPYQLLIVGDPLCQPFSNAPQPSIDTRLRTIQPKESVYFDTPSSGQRYLDWLDSGKKAAERTEPLAPTAVGVLLDGASPKTAAINSRLEIRFAGFPPGFHEIGLRFAADDPFEQRSAQFVPVWIGAPDTVRLALPGLQQGTAEDVPSVSLQSTDSLSAKITAKEGERVSLWHDHEQLAVSDGTNAELSVPLIQLGMGPVRLQAKVELADGKLAAGQPFWIQIAP